MPLRLRIDHRTRYEYERPVSLSPHFVRLFARTEPGRLVQLEQRVDRHERGMQRMKGVAGAAGGMLAVLKMALDYFRKH